MTEGICGAETTDGGTCENRATDGTRCWLHAEDLEPVHSTAWRGYNRYTCPFEGCSFEKIQNPRKPDAKKVVQNHIEEVH